MNFGVRVVEDHELPAGIKRVMVERADACPLLLLARSIAGTWNFVQEWHRAYGRGPVDAVVFLEKTG